MSNAKEAKARIKINRLLEGAGCRFFEDENGKAASRTIKLHHSDKMTPFYSSFSSRETK